MGKLIIDGNEVYEIDEECMKKKEAEKKKRTAPEKAVKDMTQERILLAGFSVCGGSLQQHNSSPP